MKLKKKKLYADYYTPCDICKTTFNNPCKKNKCQRSWMLITLPVKFELR